MAMTFRDKKLLCEMFIQELGNYLNKTHEFAPSCNLDESLYLIPNGTIDQISYYSKPDHSFRYSDHWNWYANLNKCSKKHYIQCWNVDIPYPKERKAEGRASLPRKAVAVAMIGKDGKYHTVYGEKFDKRNKKWTFITNNVQDVASMVLA